MTFGNLNLTGFGKLGALGRSVAAAVLESLPFFTNDSGTDQYFTDDATNNRYYAGDLPA